VQETPLRRTLASST